MMSMYSGSVCQSSGPPSTSSTTSKRTPMDPMASLCLRNCRQASPLSVRGEALNSPFSSGLVSDRLVLNSGFIPGRPVIAYV